MDLIVTHIGADFDGLSSLVAAKKLYPRSRLLIPGSPESSVREFLMLTKDLVPLENEKECELSDVDRLVVVDTRHRTRIGCAGLLLDRDVEVHIYDHHPRTKDGIVADKDVYQEVGATVTILVDAIRKKRIHLTPLEATIMLLGIYEETGSLTYRTTTRHDVDAVSFLLSNGANLSVVSSYLNRELSDEELSFLIKMIHSTERVMVHGVSVAFSIVESGEFSGELGMLIHKLIDIENIPVLFVFVRAPAGRINIIARSKLHFVDVNKALSYFGGGGHISAASARVSGKDIASIRERLVKILKNQIKIQVRAQDIMTKYPLLIDIGEKVDLAHDLLAKTGKPGALIADRGRIVGVTTAEDLNKALKRGYGHSRVKGYMRTTLYRVNPRTPIHTIHQIIHEKDASIVPVMKGSRLLGSIYRTDVLKTVHSGLFAEGVTSETEKAVVLNVAKKMERILPGEILALLKKIGALANHNHYTVFVVGGLVRDLILGAKNIDLDIVLEGDAIKFGSLVASQLGGTLVPHRRFGTASVVMPWPGKPQETREGNLKIDLATARKERYERPAALPQVSFSTLKDDLIRRDFTINAMAVSLNKDNFGQLIDFFGGEKDLGDGRIRVMHDGSFIDDPTRIFRAVRFEQRFGFHIDSHTESLVKDAISKGMFGRTENQRIRDELILILKEAKPLKALKRMEELGELRFINPKIRIRGKSERLFLSAERSIQWYEHSGFGKRAIDRWLIICMAMLDGLSYKETEAFCKKFVLKNSDTVRILSFARSKESVKRMLGSFLPVAPSGIYANLEPLSYETIVAIMARAGSSRAKKRIADFFLLYNGAKLRIRGDDLKEMGLKPGPQFKNVLKNLLYKKLDKGLRTKKDELEYARRLLSGRHKDRISA